MAKWDSGRFLNTVGYFGAIPIFSDVQRWLTGESKDRSSIDGGRALGLVLVVGTSGEVGQLTVGCQTHETAAVERAEGRSSAQCWRDFVGSRRIHHASIA